MMKLSGRSAKRPYDRYCAAAALALPAWRLAPRTALYPPMAPWVSTNTE